MTRLRAQLARSDVAARRNIMWVIEPERWPIAPDEVSEPSPRVPPTHLLAGAFHTLTQTSGRGRSDAYLCAFQLTDLRSGMLVWEDAWEVKRAVLGLTYD